MSRESDYARGTLRSNLLILTGLALAVFLFGTLAELSEQLWKWTRPFEDWQLDELILALVVAGIAGLIIALRRISTLETQVAELETKRLEDSKLVSLSEDHVDCVIKCVGCSKYHIHGDQWLSRKDFAALTRSSDVFGGVCPSCQLASSD